MNARMVDGSIVSLPKDCSCICHEGPHWLYVDELSRQSNQELLDLKCASGFAIEETARLQRKSNKMNAIGIVELIS